MTSSFTGRVALVAGGTGALGRAVSLAFLVDGARVVVTYRCKEELDVLKRAAGGDGVPLDGQQVDVTDEAAVNELVQGVVARHGRLDVLVNAVGGYAGGTKLWDLERKVLDQMLELNLLSGYALSRAAVPVMIAQGHGAIVNVASKAAWDHGAGEAAYAASKAAAIALIDSLAAETRGTGVRVNSVLPSMIDTEANRRAMPEADCKKWLKPGDIARVIVFLCGDDARVIHGAAIPLFGE
jgi:NAD(P)-dependent dehydrogenase (short-subunit alcohol dehydrogenase family)